MAGKKRGSYPCKPGCTCGRHRKERPEMRGRKLSKEHREKIAAAQRGRKLSPEWREAQSKGQIERHRRLREQEVDQPTHKRCTKCKEMKRVPEDYVMRKIKLATGEVRKYAAGECKECGRARAAAWRKKMKAEGKMSEIDRRHKKAYYERNPERVKALWREQDAARRRRLGAKPRGPWKKYREGDKNGRLPFKPFQDWLIEALETRTTAELSQRIGVTERQIRRWVKSDNGDGKEIETIPLKTVDVAFHALDQPEMMSILYDSVPAAA